MLRVVTIDKDKYMSLSDVEKMKPETMFLCKDAITGKCSIYSQGNCYGEDLDDENLLRKDDIAEWAKQPVKPIYTADEVCAVDREDNITILRIKEMFDSLKSTL